MCMIVYHPAGRYIDKALWSDFAKWNPHGCGVMYRTADGSIGGIKDKSLSWETMLDMVGLTFRHEFAIHWRMATHGGINDEMCHPFAWDYNKLKDTIWEADAGLMHNGILQIDIRNESLSDTAQFVKYCLKADVKPWLNTCLIQEVIGHDRLLIWHKAKGIIRLGHWTKYKGCFYSNQPSRGIVEVKNYATNNFPTNWGTNKVWTPAYDRRRAGFIDYEAIYDRDSN